MPKKYDPQLYEYALNPKVIREKTLKFKGSNRLAVDLRKAEGKGYGLYACKTIPKGRTVAYYRFRVLPYRAETGDTYAMTVYTRGNEISKTFIGDVCEESVPDPDFSRHTPIPYWAHFSNEPSGEQTENVRLDVYTRYNYHAQKRHRIKPGDILTYRLVSRRKILPDEEIVWCYGEDYHERGYIPNCARQ